MAFLNEDYLVEQPAINWFKEIGYLYVPGSELIPENRERILQGCYFKEKVYSSNKKIKSVSY